MANLISFLLGAVSGSIVLLYLLRDGTAVEKWRVRLPFIEGEFRHFGSLSPVRSFQYVSIAVLSTDPADLIVERFIRNAPSLAIHTGWSVVADAFIERFRGYPTDDKLNSVAVFLGAQNVDTIRVFRDFAAQAAKVGATNNQLVSDFVTRCPSLAERIDVNGRESAIQSILSVAERHGAQQVAR